MSEQAQMFNAPFFLAENLVSNYLKIKLTCPILDSAKTQQ